MTDIELEDFVAERLQLFYRQRLEKLQGITLEQVLKKNPYLFKSKGIANASDFVENVLQAYLSSSEETVYGNIFFEPLALEVSKAKGGMKTGSTGVDIEYESPTKHTAIAVKSATNAQNSSAQNKQNAEFIKINQTVRAKGKAFDAIIGYSYGRASGAPAGKIYRRLAGQAFWEELSGESDFYLKIIRAMKDYPTTQRQEYDTQRTKLSNRLTQSFALNFIDANGDIDWEKLLRFNSGSGRPQKLLKVASNPDTGEVSIQKDVGIGEKLTESMYEDDE
jgi:hypothetical protein